MTSKVHAIWQRLARDRSGSAATIFGLSAIPTFAILGFAIDYGTALSNKTKLDAAADAASMAAVTAAKTVIMNSATPGATATAAAQTAAFKAAAAVFKGNAGSLGFAQVPTLAVNTTTRTNQTLTSQVTYSATPVKSSFSGMIGLSQMAIQGTSVSTLTMPTYINYYVVVDISQSMGVAATPTDMQTLYNRVITYGNYDTQADKTAKIGCVFGCHVQQVSGGYTQPITNETLAHSPLYGLQPVTLRIDSAKAAIQAIVSDAQTANAQSGQNLIQIGVYTMQQDPQNAGSYIQNIATPPSSNFSTIAAKVTSMDLGNNNGGGSGDTGFSNSLNYFVNNILTSQGDGSTPAAALNYVFLVTDGLSDVPGGCTDGHCTGAFNDTLCTPIKSKATVGVIYTTYNPIYTKNDPTQGFVDTYRDLVNPYVGSIPGNLQACSSGAQWYFEASDGPAITTGMQKLFAPTALQARISQ